VIALQRRFSENHRSDPKRSIPLEMEKKEDSKTKVVAALALVALACVLSGSAFAGDAHTVGAPAPGNTQGPGVAATVILTILSLIR
jgi:hypothetical protein